MLKNIKRCCNKIIFSLILTIGMIITGYFISNAIYKSKSLSYVEIQGASERIITSDSSMWIICIKATGSDLIKVNNKIELDRSKVVEFLLEQGFNKEEIEFGDHMVEDLQTRDYNGRGVDNKYRYIIKSNIILKTADVQKIKEASHRRNLLVQKGITLGGNSYYEGPFYELTNFNDMKLDMLEEAIKNARKAAEKIAKNSNTKIGLLKQANQKSFSINPFIGTRDNSEYGDSVIDKKSFFKKVKLVVTLQYYLKD